MFLCSTPDRNCRKVSDALQAGFIQCFCLILQGSGQSPEWSLIIINGITQSTTSCWIRSPDSCTHLFSPLLLALGFTLAVTIYISSQIKFKKKKALLLLQLPLEGHLWVRFRCCARKSCKEGWGMNYQIQNLFIDRYILASYLHWAGIERNYSPLYSVWASHELARLFPQWSNS